MSNTSDEIRLLEAEIEKVTKEINELSRHIRDRYKMVYEVLLIPGNKGSMDIERKNLNEERKALEGLKAYLQTLLKSKAVKFNKIVHREEYESFEKEVAELKQKKAELSAKYGRNSTNTPQGTAGREGLGFTYNKQLHALTLKGKGMKLSKKRARLFESLKKHRNIRWVLKELYSEYIERDEKVIDNKSVSFYSFVSKFNKSWRNHFELDEELELIKCKDEIVSIVQKIDWK